MKASNNVKKSILEAHELYGYQVRIKFGFLRMIEWGK
jgi:hypothetical protein